MSKIDKLADPKFKEAIKELQHALSFENKIYKDNFYFSGIAKSFETCFEYSWKYLKAKVEGEGLESYSPKESIKLAGRLGIIENVEKWLRFVDIRNIAVHNYLGISKEIYLGEIKNFLQEINKLGIE